MPDGMGVRERQVHPLIDDFGISMLFPSVTELVFGGWLIQCPALQKWCVRGLLELPRLRHAATGTTGELMGSSVYGLAVIGLAPCIATTS